MHKLRANFAGKLLGRLFLASIILLLQNGGSLQTVQASSKAEAPFIIHILHTNDIHAHDQPFMEKGNSVGGMTRIAAVIKQVRSKDPGVMVVDAGDVFQGTPFFEVYKGEVEVELLNLLGCKLMALGNHEFDNGSEMLSTALQKAKFQPLCSNMDMSAVPALKQQVKPSMVLDVQGQKVGFVGVITPSVEEICPKLQGVRLKGRGREWYKPVADEVAKLKAAGVNKIVLLSHSGVSEDKYMAQNIPDVDLIIGGHSHSRLERPIKVYRPHYSSCLIVQTGCYGRALGEIKAAFDASGRILSDKSTYRLIDITGNLPEDPEVKQYLANKAAPFAEQYKAIVGQALGSFSNRFYLYAGDSPLGNLVCDALAHAGAHWGATISLQNRGGMRSWIDRGPISMAKIHELLPFNNKLVVTTVSGETLWRNLENSVSMMQGGRFLDVHGLRLVYDPLRPAGQRLVKVDVKGKDGKFVPLQSGSAYRIALNDYTFSGTEGFDFSSAYDTTKTGVLLSQVFADYLVHMKSVGPFTEKRVTRLSYKKTEPMLD